MSALFPARFKGSKGKGPAQQRIRDDSTKPQISELTANENGKTQGGVRSAPGRPSENLPSTALLKTLTSTTLVRCFQTSPAT